MKPAEVERKWFLIDAAGKPLGRVAAEAAVLLRGKNKVTFTPNVDCGDHVIIINTDKAVLTGKKLEKKYYRTHSGWIGGLKEIQYKTLMAENSDKAMYVAVKGMVPANTIGTKAMTRNEKCTRLNLISTAPVVVRAPLPAFAFTTAPARSPSTIVTLTSTLVWRP